MRLVIGDCRATKIRRRYRGFRAFDWSTGRYLELMVAKLLINAMFGSLVESLRVQESHNLYGRVSLGYL